MTKLSPIPRMPFAVRKHIFDFARTHWPIIFFIFWALILSFEYWGFGADSYLRIFDSADGRLATRLALKTNFSQMEVGYWNWDMLTGVDRLAEGNSLEWINLIFYTLPGWLAYGIFMFLQRLVAGFFTYRLLQKHLNVRPIVALFPAMFYAMWSQAQFNKSAEGFTVPNSFSLAGIPMILFLLGEISSKVKNNTRKTLMLVGLLGFAFAGMTNFAFSIFLFPLIFIWLFLISRRNFRFALEIFFVFTIGWLALEGWELYAAWLQAPAAHRTLRESCISLGTWGPDEIITGQFDTNNFPLLMLGFAGFAFYRKSISYRNLLVVFALLAIVDMASDLLPHLLCSEMNPFEFLSRFNTKRAIRYTPFFISLLAGVSLENILLWLEARGGKRIKQMAKSIAAIFLLAFVYWIVVIAVDVKIQNLQLRENGYNYRNIFENPYFEYVGELVEGNTFTRSAVVFHNSIEPRLHAGYFWPYGVNTIDGYTTIYPLKYSEFWRVVIDPMMSQYKNCQYGRSLLNGDNRLRLSTKCGVGELADELDFDNWFNLDLLSLLGTKYLISEHPIDNEYLIELDLSGIRCREEILGCKSYHIYENPNAYPALFARAEIVYVASPKKILDRLSQSDAQLLAKKVFMLSDDIRGFSEAGLASGDVNYEFTGLSFDKISFQISTNTSQIIIINSAYSPYWRVSVNRIEKDLFPVYHVLTGLYLPEGNHEIVMTYEPPYSLLTYYFKLERLLDR